MDYINIIKNHLLDILEFQQNLDADLDFDLKDSELKSFHEAFKKQKKETKIKILELKKCIDNYSMVLSDQKYWYSYKHGIDEFFRSGDRKPAPYVKFLPERFVEENFLTKKGGGYDGKPVPRNCKTDDEYSSVR